MPLRIVLEKDRSALTDWANASPPAGTDPAPHVPFEDVYVHRQGAFEAKVSKVGGWNDYHPPTLRALNYCIEVVAGKGDRIERLRRHRAIERM